MCSPPSRCALRASSRRALAGIDALQVPERQGRLRIVTPRLIAAAHRHDVEVHVWTVNDPADMRRLVAMGVDGIVTDRADSRSEPAALSIVCEWTPQGAPFG